MNKEKVFFFCHIPKTAGSTFDVILRRNFIGKYLWLTHAFLSGD